MLHTLWRCCQGLLTLVLDTPRHGTTQLDSTPAQMDAPGQANDKVNVNLNVNVNVNVCWQQEEGLTLTHRLLPLLPLLQLVCSHLKKCCR